jgi:hypothetical protein
MINTEMVNGKIKYEFTAEVWQYSAPGGWFFVSVEYKISQEIRETLQWLEEGWGRLKATAKIGNSTWKTFIWFDTKKNTYFLPLKSEIRKKEKIEAGRSYLFTIWI